MAKTAKKSSTKKSVTKRQTKGIFPPTRRKKPSAKETYPLNITAGQFETLEYRTQIKPKLKQQLKEASTLKQPALLPCDNLHYLYDRLCKVASRAVGREQDDLYPLLNQVIDLLDVAYGPFDLIEPTKDPLGGSKSTGPVEYVLQFKVSLRDTCPAVWRQIQVPDCDLESFHLYIQAAFGWENAHLHAFKIDGFEFGMQMEDSASDWEDETKFLLSDLLPESNRPCCWTYEYDFGDGWEHDIELEGYAVSMPRAKYPRCTAGESACPPEDCGGVWGYAHLLNVLSDPDDPEREEMLEYYGKIDPAKFSTTQASKEMQTITEIIDE